MTLDLESLVNDVKKIAEKAGKAIMEVYNELHDEDIEYKSDQSPVTLADKKANEIIISGLSKLTPNISIISEEKRNESYEIRKKFSYIWIIDPLDGTKEFIKKNNEFTVNIALIKDGIPVLGVVNIPALGEEYFATKGGNAFRRLPKKRRRKIQVQPFKMDDKRIKVVCSRSHMNAETSAFLGELKKPIPVYCGSSLKFLVVARGDAHIYPRIAPTMEWDTAAAQVIVEAAGGIVEANASKEPLTYNKENFLNPYFIARAAYTKD